MLLEEISGWLGVDRRRLDYGSPVRLIGIRLRCAFTPNDVSA
jgi:hypothetical protein